MASSNGRQTLVQRIAMDGGEEIKKELASLGKAGEEAFAQLKAAADKANVGLGAKLAAAVADMRVKLQALQAAGVQLGGAFNVFTIASEKFGSSISAAAKKIGLVTTAIAAAVGAALLFAKSEAANSERIDNQSKALGISAQAYQNFETAATNAGLEGTAFDKILQKFIVNAAEAGDTTTKAADGTTKLANSIEQVAVKAEDGSDKIITIVRGSGQLAEGIKKVTFAAGGGEKALIAFAKKITALGSAQERIQALLAAGFEKKTVAQTITFLRAIANDADDMSRALSKTVGPLSDLQIAVGVDLDNAFDRLGTNLSRTKSILIALFDPALTLTANLFADLIYENRDAILAFAASVRDNAIRVVLDLLALFRGADGEVQNKWIISIRDGVVLAGAAIKSTIFDVVVPAFQQISTTAQLVADLINQYFGTKLTGSSLLVTAVILKLSGAFGILVSSIGLVAAAINLGVAGFAAIRAAIVLIGPAISIVIDALVAIVGGIAAILGLPAEVVAVVVIAAAAIAAAIYANWDAIKAKTAELWDTVKAGAAEAVQFLAAQFAPGGFINGFVTDAIGLFQSLWTSIKDGVGGAFSYIESTAIAAISGISSAITSLIASVSAALSAIRSLASARTDTGGGGGFASGGYVAGAGSGTSDSIPAWLSNGEFVIRAAAVKKFGAQFFAMLNGLKMPQFNLGGLVDPFMHATAPRFAGGGMVTVASSGATSEALHPVTLQIGGQNISGFSATKTAIQHLTRQAGRKPAWA